MKAGCSIAAGQGTTKEPIKESMSDTRSELTVSLWRGAQQGRYETYKVPSRENQTVLDVVTFVQRHLDPTLLRPILQGLRWALPYRLSKAGLATGGPVQVTVGEPVNERWTLVATDNTWTFSEAAPEHVTTRASFTADQSWRLLTNNLKRAAGPVDITGDERVAPDAQASDQPGVAACSDAAERGPRVAAGDRDPQLALRDGERELDECDRDPEFDRDHAGREDHGGEDCGELDRLHR